jgi:hypothetical protein
MDWQRWCKEMARPAKSSLSPRSGTEISSWLAWYLLYYMFGSARIAAGHSPLSGWIFWVWTPKRVLGWWIVSSWLEIFLGGEVWALEPYNKLSVRPNRFQAHHVHHIGWILSSGSWITLPVCRLNWLTHRSSLSHLNDACAYPMSAQWRIFKAIQRELKHWASNFTEFGWISMDFLIGWMRNGKMSTKCLIAPAFLIHALSGSAYLLKACHGRCPKEGISQSVCRGVIFSIQASQLMLHPGPWSHNRS